MLISVVNSDVCEKMIGKEFRGSGGENACSIDSSAKFLPKGDARLSHKS
jgi:hypothetical protein